MMNTIDTTLVDVMPAKTAQRSPSAALFGGMGLLVRRRLWRDRVLLISSALIVALSTLLAYAGPQLVLNTIDAGVADAINTAGSDADIVVTYPVGNTRGDNVNSAPGTDATRFVENEQTVVDNLPGAAAALVQDSSSWVLSQQVTFAYVVLADELERADAAGEDPEQVNRLGDHFQFGFADNTELEVVAGRLPRDATGEPIEPATETDPEIPEIIEIALTEEVANFMELGLGDQVTVRNIFDVRVTLEVVGLVDEADPASPAWDRFPEVTDPVLVDNPAFPLFRRGTVMVSPATINVLTERLATPFPATVYLSVEARGLTLDNSQEVPTALAQLQGATGDLLPGQRVAITVETGLARALEAYPPRARAALAQMSVVVAGVVAVAAVVIALMARLLLSRRESDIALERARGSSIPSMGVRLLIESVLFAAVGFAAGYTAAFALVGVTEWDNPIAFLVAIVAAFASPVLGVSVARRTWTGRRESANRQDRAKVRKAREAKRLTLEVLAIVIGVLAVVTLRGRGVLQTQTSTVDPFLAAAPVLLALAVTVVVVRVYPMPMALIRFFAKRTRGVVGVITLAKSRERIPVLPLLALTLAIAVAVSGGLLIGTVASGQEQASWERVGAQVRVDGEIGDDVAAELREAGLLVSEAYTRGSTTFVLGATYESAEVLAIDDAYADTIEAGGFTDVTQLRELQAAYDDIEPGDPLPILASQRFIDLDFEENQQTQLYIGRTYVPVEIIGLATVTPEGWLDGPYVLMPFDGLLAQDLSAPIARNVLFVTGDGAEDAVESFASIAPEQINTRQGWLTAARESALIGGVERIMALAVIAVGVLAAVALLVTVLQGVRERGRALSMFRTQGMGNGYGWWLALAELVPLTVAAVTGGAAAGLLILLLLGGTLGLEVLSGGIAAPPLVANVEFMVAVGAGVLTLLFIAVAAEVLTHRRNKLSEVLRYGESR